MRFAQPNASGDEEWKLTAGGLGSDQARAALAELPGSKDEEIAEAASEALLMADSVLNE